MDVWKKQRRKKVAGIDLFFIVKLRAFDFKQQMIFTKTKLPDIVLIDIDRKQDERGFFGRTFCRQELVSQGIDFNIAQSNLSYNKTKGTLRGMHMQLAPFKEAKLVQCIRGSIYDVVIDMRKESATYCQWLGTELSEKNKTILYIPEGFAHGFITLENDTEVSYQMSEFYKPGYEKGLLWNDPFFNISWPIAPVVMSDKDKTYSLFQPESYTSI